MNSIRTRLLTALLLAFAPLPALMAETLVKGQRVKAVEDYEKVTAGDEGWFYMAVADGEPSMLVVWDRDIDSTPNVDYLEKDFPRILSGRVYFVNSDNLASVPGVKKVSFDKLAKEWRDTASPETLFPVGSKVILGKHSLATPKVPQSVNWQKGQDSFVGKEAVITAHVGLDDYDKAGVHVDIDSEEADGPYFWRVENLTLVERNSVASDDSGDDEYSGDTDDNGEYSEGEDYSEDGAYSDGDATEEAPQELDAEDTAFFEKFPVGTHVILGRHTAVSGEEDSDNWTEEMDAYVGKEAIITSHEGLCPWGEASVLVDIDEGTYYWRLRDMKKVK